MVGERYSHSLDIGKELEREKEEGKKGEQPPLPCFCSPKIRPKSSEKKEVEEEERKKKEESAPDHEKKDEAGQEKVQEPTKEENAEKQASEKQEFAKNTELQQETAEQQSLPCVEVKPAELSEDSGWEQMEGVVPAGLQSIPDPIEEDVNAIITKEVPVLHPEKSIVECLLKRKFLLFFVFVGLVAGFFLVWKLVLPEQEPAANEFQFESVAAFVPANITLFSATVTEAAEYVGIPEQSKVSEETAVEEVVPVEAVVHANASSLDELPDLFAQQLRD